MECVRRVVMIGDAGTGKTSLVAALFDRPFDMTYQETIGAAFHTYPVASQPGTGIQLWDTAGQERYRSLGPIYFRKSSGAVLVYDLGSPESVKGLEAWFTEFRSVVGENVPVFVVANKSDLIDGEPDVLVQGRNWAHEKRLDFFETSAKTGANVKQMFQWVFEAVLRSEVDNQRQETVEESSKERCC